MSIVTDHPNWYQCIHEWIIPEDGNGLVEDCPKCGKPYPPSIQPLYRTWLGMISRCENPNNKSFSHYGERGIKVCERWHTYENFVADMGPCPVGFSIDRVDNNGDYTPENCMWTTSTFQNRNKRNLGRLPKGKPCFLPGVFPKPSARADSAAGDTTQQAESPNTQP